MADLDLDRLEALAQEATPGPWYVDTIRDMGEESFAISGVVRWRGYTNNLSFDEDEATCRYVAAANPEAVLALIARLREAEDAMNVCARCGEAIDEEQFDRRWPEGWERCTSPIHEGRTVVHSVRYHQRPEVQAEEADAATPTPSTPITP